MAKRAVIIGTAAAILAVTAGTRASAQGTQGRLERAVAALDLNEQGARRWLGLIRLGVERPEHERVLAVDRTGSVVDSVEGGTDRIPLPLAFQARLRDADAGLVLVHNHPRDTGLSADDLSLLARPGVAAVAALGHGGSVYLASAGAAFNHDDAGERQINLARAHLTKQLGQRQAARALSPGIGAEHFAHLMSLVLAKAGVIEYRATLGSVRRESFERTRAILLDAILTAAAGVQSETRSRTRN